jgi:hypothetical protein
MEFVGLYRMSVSTKTCHLSPVTCPQSLCYNPCSCIQAIIRYKAGVSGLKKIPILLLFVLPASLICLGCGNGTPSSSRTSGLPYRAFISNSVSSGTSSAGVYVINALSDVRPAVAPIPAGNNPGMMVVTPNLALTLVFSGIGTQASDNQFTVINNASESAVGHVSLPGLTESFVVSPDSSTAYIALPTATVVGEPPGLVEVISLNSGAFSGQVNIPSVHYLSINNTGNRIFGFSDNSNSIAVITPSDIGIPGDNPVSFICCFDSPIWALFSPDDTTAYVLNCGPECGGTQASIQKVDLTLTQCLPSGVCPPVSVPAATVAMLNGSTLFLAGTPYTGGLPSQPCTGQTTQATTCGLLTQFNLNTMSVVGTPLIITDGYHTRMSMGANGQLFIGARTCTEIVPPIPAPPGAETRGCLSVYNTLTTPVGSAPAGGIFIPPANGDVTGLQPIGQRTDNHDLAQQVIYVIQGGSLDIYDLTIDALEYNPNNQNNPGKISNLVGQFIDVKIVDF